MARIAVLSDCWKSRARYLEEVIFPDNYMEDFTLMGFLVDKIDVALFLLGSAGYSLRIGTSGAELIIDSPESLSEISRLFSENNILFSWADIVDTAYQA